MVNRLVSVDDNFKFPVVIEKSIRGVPARINTVATTAATPTASATNDDMLIATGMTVNMTVGAPTGTPYGGQMILYRFKDSGVARTMAWNVIFRAVGVTLPTTTVISKTLYVGTVYNAVELKWDVIAVGQQA